MRSKTAKMNRVWELMKSMKVDVVQSCKHDEVMGADEEHVNICGSIDANITRA